MTISASCVLLLIPRTNPPASRNRLFVTRECSVQMLSNTWAVSVFREISSNSMFPTYQLSSAFPVQRHIKKSV